MPPCEFYLSQFSTSSIKSAAALKCTLCHVRNSCVVYVSLIFFVRWRVCSLQTVGKPSQIFNICTLPISPVGTINSIICLNYSRLHQTRINNVHWTLMESMAILCMHFNMDTIPLRLSGSSNLHDRQFFPPEVVNFSIIGRIDSCKIN